MGFSASQFATSTVLSSGEKAILFGAEQLQLSRRAQQIDAVAVELLQGRAVPVGRVADAGGLAGPVGRCAEDRIGAAVHVGVATGPDGIPQCCSPGALAAAGQSGAATFVSPSCRAKRKGRRLVLEFLLRGIFLGGEGAGHTA